MKVALLGIGRWGANIKRTLAAFQNVAVVGFDKKSSPTPEQLKDQDILAVLIATPGSTHADVAIPFIEAGFPVFIEKPMTTSLRDAQRLQRLAKRTRNNRIFVGHIHLYNPAFYKAASLIKQAGKIRAVWFEGMNWGPFREDMSAMWDWMPHDVAMALELFGRPTSVQAWGDYHTTIARVMFRNLPVHMHVSTLSPEKRKRMTVVGSKYTIVFDDTKPKQKVMKWRDGRESHPAYSDTPPLMAELKAFLHMVRTKRVPKTDLSNGLTVVRIVDAVERSTKQRGKLIAL